MTNPTPAQLERAKRRLAAISPADEVQRLQASGDITTPEEADAYYAGWAEAIEELLCVGPVVEPPTSRRRRATDG